MKIIEKSEEGDKLRFLIDSDEESLLSLLKTYLEANADVDVVGVYKEHHLINKTEFLLKVKKGSASALLKKTLGAAKKDLLTKKVK